MAVSQQFVSFVLDQLGAVRKVTHRRMFGGAGFYAGELFFALADDDTLYFKVDDSNRADFIREGMQPFQPFGPDSKPMGYYAVPPRVLDDVDELKLWMQLSIAVAARHKR